MRAWEKSFIRSRGEVTQDPRDSLVSVRARGQTAKGDNIGGGKSSPPASIVHSREEITGRLQSFLRHFSSAADTDLVFYTRRESRRPAPSSQRQCGIPAPSPRHHLNNSAGRR